MNAVSAFENALRELRRKRRAGDILFAGLFTAALLLSMGIGEVRIDTFIEGFPGLFSYIRDTLPEIHTRSVAHDVGQWYWGITRWISLLFDTVVIAFLATLIGAAGAFLICFPASRNLMNNLSIYFICRRIMELARSVPELVYAMIFVFAFGLGPFPGVLAICIHSAGSLGKLFSEVNEKEIG
jgi:phosphonate transport system permease protein